MGKMERKWQHTEYVLSFFGNSRSHRRDYFKYVEKGVRLGKRSEFVGGGLIRSSGGWSEVLALRARIKITLHFKRRCILPDCVTKA